MIYHCGNIRSFLKAVCTLQLLSSDWRVCITFTCRYYAKRLENRMHKNVLFVSNINEPKPKNLFSTRFQHHGKAQACKIFLYFSDQALHAIMVADLWVTYQSFLNLLNFGEGGINYRFGTAHYKIIAHEAPVRTWRNFIHFCCTRREKDWL